MFKSDKNNFENVELISFANNFGIYLSDREKIEKNSIIYRIKAKLQNEGGKFSFLFIFDNYEENECTINYINQLSDLNNVFILVTTKDIKLKEKLSSKDSIFIYLEPFESLETIEFIKKNLQYAQYDNNNESEINELIKLFQNEKVRPSILIKIVAFINIKLEQNIKLNSIINEFKKNDKKNFEEVITDDDFFNLIRQKNENSFDILNYSSFLDPDFIPFDIFTELLTIDEDYLNKTVVF